MKSQLSVSTDEHRNVARPLEVTHDIQSANITGEAEGSIIWIPIVFDAAVGGVPCGNKFGRNDYYAFGCCFLPPNRRHAKGDTVS
ncbi:MAG: hypothetical protein MUF77_09675 [Leptospira sp.]|nr:hypothetical protein [Leptospira sp.]